MIKRAVVSDTIEEYKNAESISYISSSTVCLLSNLLLLKELYS